MSKRRTLPGLTDDRQENITFKVNIRDAIFTLPDGISVANFAVDLIHIGDPAGEHIRINPTSVAIRNGETVYAQLTGTTLTIGETSTEHISITPTAVEIKDSSQVYTKLEAGTLTLGTPSIAGTPVRHMVISSTAVQLKDGNTIYTELTNGNLTLGPTASEHVAISGDQLNINTNVAILPRISTTTRNALAAVNGMIIYNTTTGQMEGYTSGSWSAL